MYFLTGVLHNLGGYFLLEVRMDWTGPLQPVVRARSSGEDFVVDAWYAMDMRFALYLPYFPVGETQEEFALWVLNDFNTGTSYVVGGAGLAEVQACAEKKIAKVLSP